MLVTCRECREFVSTDSRRCPKCGCRRPARSAEEEAVRREKRAYAAASLWPQTRNRWALLVGMVLVAVCMLVSALSIDAETREIREQMARLDRIGAEMAAIVQRSWEAAYGRGRRP